MNREYKSSAAKVKLNRFEDLFGEIPEEMPAGQVQELPLEELYSFCNHPFQVRDDKKMEELKESIARNGILVPGLARKRAEGGYELISGHCRKHAALQAGLTHMPVIVQDYTDDEAIIIMVDSNIQREDILPSEKAKAYKMKYEALKHQGSRNGGNTLDGMGEKAGESAKTVQRYIWLARLSDELLELVDKKRIGFVQGLDFSNLSETDQHLVWTVLSEQKGTVGRIQSAKLKEYAKMHELILPMVQLILFEAKPKKRKVLLREEQIERYFDDTCDIDEIETVICNLLEDWKKQQAGGQNGSPSKI
ncbi:MAG: ParB/RepB/Spo0J family partition protein [Lachnospiraceae bacterium]|nr:ParB/RepB/Spo0J family partition protein [Lachnospiraceae bacterium]